MAAQRGLTSPNQTTIKRLFALSSNRCAFRRCTSALVVGETVVGEVCHIKAASKGGPRYDDQQTDAERHGFANLMLMCGMHHTLVDSDEEAYTVTYLTKLKAERESGATQIDEEVIEHATSLLINQSVASVQQPGGITAHTVNADTINLHPSAIVVGGVRPNWSIQELFRYLRPRLNASDSMTLWDEAGDDVLDKLSTGELHAWGREILRGQNATAFHNLAPIEASYWRTARFTFVFLLDEHERDKHVTQRAQSTLPDYADVRVSREEAIELWPHPQLGRWSVQSITLTARYFNHAPDELSVACKTVTLFDAHIKTECEASGAAYSRVIAQAHILATGIDPTAVRSLSWTPQELAFIDLTTNSEQRYLLTGMPDTSFHSSRIKFLLDYQASLAPQPISPASYDRALELFSTRSPCIHGGVDAPAVLRRGPKLILQIVPLSAFDGRTIDHAAPKVLGQFFVPDGHSTYEDRPRQEGWVWHQPGVPGLFNALY